MAGEQRFNTRVLAALERQGLGWLVVEIRAGWSAAGLPLSPSEDQNEAILQAEVVADALDVLRTELESLNSVRVAWPEVVFSSSGDRSNEPVLSVMRRTADTDAIGMLAATTGRLREALALGSSVED